MRAKIYAGLMVGICALSMMTGCQYLQQRDSAELPQKKVAAEATTEEENIDPIRAVCKNGVMVGKEEDGVVAFLGVPFAQAPTGNGRWRKAEPPKKSDNEILCQEFGDTAVQRKRKSEAASYTEKSENCLTLNVWKSEEKSNKARKVMVFFHGGDYSWGGTADPIYNGHNFVKEHPDIILITCNYRLGLMAWADFSGYNGGSEYTDLNIGLRDQIRALNWLQDNLKAFGGDPDNVTVFGESSGASCIAGLLYSPKTDGLFQRAILQSGVFLPKERSAAKTFAEYIMKAANCTSMEGLLNISDKEWMKLDREQRIGDEACGIVCDGEVIPETEEERDEILEGKIKNGVTIMIGANADSVNCSFETAKGDTEQEKFETWTAELNETWKKYYERSAQKGKDFMDRFKETQEMKIPAEYSGDDNVKDALIKASFVTESLRMDLIRFADKYYQMGGTVYMYYWDIPSTKKEFFKSSCRAVELAYIFHNIEDNIHAGEVDEASSMQTQDAWASFAKDGDPSTDKVRWTNYNDRSHDTMMIERDDWYMESDPTGQFRDGLESIGASLSQ